MRDALLPPNATEADRSDLFEATVNRKVTLNALISSLAITRRNHTLVAEDSLAGHNRTYKNF
jgi:hypothetical protein